MRIAYKVFQETQQNPVLFHTNLLIPILLLGKQLKAFPITILFELSFSTKLLKVGGSSQSVC